MSKRVVAVFGICLLTVGVLTIPLFGQSADRTKGSAGRSAGRSPGQATVSVARWNLMGAVA